MDGGQGAGGDESEWRAVWPDCVPKQEDVFNCGIFVIANVLAVALGEEDCGRIDANQWRNWLATEAIEKGRRDRTHTHEDLLPGGAGNWHTCLGLRPHPATDAGAAVSNDFFLITK